MTSMKQTLWLICLQKLRGGYNGEPSIFDGIDTDDLVLSFFPCVRFENQIMLGFRGQMKQQKTWTYKQKMEYDMKLLSELKHNYDLVNKMFIICMDKNLRLVMENPYSQEHFLRRYWCYPPSIIDKDRRESGDYFAKPTQYWFLNCEPKDNLIFEPITYNHLGTKDTIRLMSKEDWEKTGAPTNKVARSMIHPDYANRFIRQHLIDI